jgi:ABC-type dipeptide/oligopeptide/nickel transport system permease component|tara:strand:+ start:1787 stop:2725 length:939 start_codon:yes stop_codon:yes gene_type:complete
MKYFYYLSSRILSILPVIFGVTLVSFFLIHLIPGDPVRIMLHGRATDEVVKQIYHELGWDKHLIRQYLDFLFNAIRGDFGKSYIQKAPVSDLIFERLSPSIFLLIYASILSIIISLPLSYLSSIKVGSYVDHFIRSFGLIGFAMPPFWIGILLILIFGLYLNIFPVGGYGVGFFEHLYFLFLPSLTIALFLSPMLTQSLRASILDNLSSDYVEVAKSKGLTNKNIIIFHVLKNSLIPVITILAVNLSWLISGAVIIEYVFSIPGLGSLLIRAISYRDYPVIQGLCITFSAMVVIVNLLADLCYMLINPRVLK